ncbi:MAG: class I adenylate-forming enzyme family protein, partial [Pseudomonadota bacterium]
AFYGMHRIGAVPVLAIPRHGAREIAHFLGLMAPKGWILPLRDGKREFRGLVEEVKPREMGVEHVIMLGDGEEIPGGALSMEGLMAAPLPSDRSSDFLKGHRPDPNDVALILLTGGTTGMPKGVPRTHNSYLTNIRYTNEDTEPDDVRALATPIGHSMAHQGPVGGGIFYGATLCLIPAPRTGPILKAVQRHRITMISFVPTQLEDFLNDPDLDKYDLSSLRKARTAGAALRPETIERARAFFAMWGAEFVGGGFGSSEGPCASHRPGEPPEVFQHSIGRPMCEGDHWKVLDGHERALPPGKEGELAARGPCVFTGYYRSEAENSEIFTRDGYYKMGDLGRIDKEGHIYITGRKKDIIQRGGEGIIPSDMEEMLHLHPDILAAAVVGMPDPRLGEKACACVVLKPGTSLTFDGMIDFMKSRGASVLQLPEKLVVVDALPRTPVGKPDKEALRKDIRERMEKKFLMKKR